MKNKVYPSWRYHKNLDAKIIHSAEEDEALGNEWATTPAAFEEVKNEKAQSASEAEKEAQKEQASILEGKEEIQILKKAKKGDK